MALQCARKDAREQAPGSGVFSSYFQGENQGRLEAPLSRISSPCALAHPMLRAAANAPRVSRSRPHNHETVGVSGKLWVPLNLNGVGEGERTLICGVLTRKGLEME